MKTKYIDRTVNERMKRYRDKVKALCNDIESNIKKIATLDLCRQLPKNIREGNLELVKLIQQELLLRTKNNLPEYDVVKDSRRIM